MSDIRSAVKEYFERGWRPIPVKDFEKAPLHQAWHELEAKIEDFTPSNNVGIVLGSRSANLVDIDLDIPQAKALMRRVSLLAGLPSFGREGEDPGHFLVTCRDAPEKVTQFVLPKNHGLSIPKDMVLELRTGGQTVFPPSRYRRPDGTIQNLAWTASEAPKAIPEYGWSDLYRAGAVLAFLSVILAAYPAEGNRDNTCMALAGTLVRLGMQAEQADELVYAVAICAGDEEAEKRRGKAQMAAEKLAASEEVTGLPALLEMVGLSHLEKILRKWLKQKDSASVMGLPAGAIIVEEGNLIAIVDQAESALIAAKKPIYERGNELVRAVVLHQGEHNDGINRQAGSTVLLPCDSLWLVQAMADATGWYKRTGGENPDLRQIDPPQKYASHLRARTGEWRFPSLVGISSTPTILPDGRLLQDPGFDASTGLLLSFDGEAFERVPDNPDRAAAEHALELLKSPMRAFPFDSEASKSVALAAVLTGLMRVTMRTAPMHAFDAPAAGTGKSLLTSLVGIIATGREPAAMSQGKDPEEDEKRLGAALRSGDAILLIDNCVRPIRGDFICSMLTQTSVSIRILGESRNMQLPSRVLVMATGNNLDIAEDMTRRAVICRLDAGEEDPEKREFDFDCLKEAREIRAKLVVAGLTILRAYSAAGFPIKLEPFGSFADYDLVRGALVWLGLADPVASREKIVAADPARAVLAEILSTWHALYADRGMMVAGLGRELNANQSSEAKNLKKALEQVSRGYWDAAKIGRFLKLHRDRRLGGLVLRSSMKSKQHIWRVEGPNAKSESMQSAASIQEEIPF